MKVRKPGDSVRLLEAIQYINKTWPWWQRNHGARHLIVHPGDTGRSETVPEARRVTINSTWITHWGLTQDCPRSGYRGSHRPDKDIVVPNWLETGRVLSRSPLHPLHPDDGEDFKLEMMFAGRICGGREAPNATKDPVCEHIKINVNNGYSQGVRQDVFQHHWNRTGFKINVSNPTYLTE
eukprot:gene16902-23179_t